MNARSLSADRARSLFVFSSNGFIDTVTFLTHENLCEGKGSSAVIQIIDVKGETITGLRVRVQEQKEHRDLLFPIPSPLSA